MKWCVLTKPIGIKEPIGIYCNTGFDYFGESDEYIDHDFGIDGAKGYAFSFRECLKIANPIWKWVYEGEIDLIVPVFLAKIIFLKNTIKATKLLKWALHSDPEHDNLADFDTKWKEAEQFIKEIEK